MIYTDTAECLCWAMYTARKVEIKGRNEVVTVLRR